MFEPSTSLFDLIPAVISACVLCFAIDLWRRAIEAARGVDRHGRPITLGAILAAWAGLALLATHVPAVGRFVGLTPGLQPVLLLAAIAAPVLAVWSAGNRGIFDGIPFESLLTFFYWRAVFGALLLVAGAVGRLPTDFAISAGLGDIAVTILMVMVLAIRTASGSEVRGAVLLWNTIGFVDMVNVLVGAATVVRPWAEHRGMPGQFGLQLFGVPIFIALHILVFGRLWRERQTASRPLAV
ncbi:hypothetical protein JQ633_07795 [Bradyrhizobium tropiciagri]|uniref:hypothetical protein n=1 Tax=Bradyrhizobium tropiciagri TaxID=312253 RepID=UPI001BABE6DE|nr:hypothetical protein [Bradyrhizobium tropiciagri]MBR0870254.1 hypothetical protein [Bradyrhizobium tropiciagri]